MVLKRVIVFGGRGFVGSSICRELARRKIPVLSVSRSCAGERVEGVQHQGGIDALKPDSYRSLLEGAIAVVATIGEPPWTEKTGGTKERAVQMNGLTNVTVLREASLQQVPSVVVVSATMPTWNLIAGYREGKEMMETEARQYPETSGLGSTGCTVQILKPGVVMGTRYVGRLPIPLWLILLPVRWLMQLFSGVSMRLEKAMPNLFGGVLSPPVWVTEIAVAAADAIENEAGGGVQVLAPSVLLQCKK